MKQEASKSKSQVRQYVERRAAEKEREKAAKIPADEPKQEGEANDRRRT